MITLADLWLPILLSAAAVFIASALAWMVMPHHRGDMKPLPDEDGFLASLRPRNVPPGVYVFPHMKDCGKMNSDPAIKAKFEQGPLGMLHIWPQDAFSKMGRNMAFSFIFYLITSVFVAYIATHALEPGANYLKVFQITGTAAIMAYCFGAVPQAIWFNVPFRNVVASLIDGVVYGLLTAGFFGWLWPSAA